MSLSFLPLRLGDAQAPEEPIADQTIKATQHQQTLDRMVSHLDRYIERAGAFIGSNQAKDGSWPYFHSRTPGFEVLEPHANLFGTMITLMNLTKTELATSSVFDRGAEYVQGRMLKGFCWSFYKPERFGDESWLPPDSDDTAVALTLLAERVAITAKDLQQLRALFDRHRAANGLYSSYLDGFYPEKGFVPDPRIPSLGVNLNVLGFFGRYELERSLLVDAMRNLTRVERYWEKTPFYQSLPVLAYLASNALEHGAPEAEELLRRFLEDLEVTEGAQSTFSERLLNLDLAAYIKARSHLCLIDLSACRDLDSSVAELGRRQKADGSWAPAPFYEYDTNKDALRAFLERRDFMIPRERGGFDYDVERGLDSPGTIHYYDGSPVETTSFALKALVVYRELVVLRGTWNQRSNEPAAR
jgi:hypothetical protein